MFLKLFRHDWKSLSRWLVPVIVGIFGAAALGFINALVLGSSMRLHTTPGQEVVIITSFSGTALVAMALAAAMTVVIVLIFVKFYKSMVTDEAYLTFTLPVSAGKLIGAKFLSGALWTVIGALTVFAAWMIILSGILITADSDLRRDLTGIAGDLVSAAFDNPAFTFSLLAYAVTGAVRSWFQITCAILFGASVVRKNKALMAVGMVLLVNFAVNIILSICGISGLLPFAISGYGMTESSGLDFPTMMWIQSAVNALLAAVFWWWSVRIAKNSVNIE